MRDPHRTLPAPASWQGVHRLRQAAPEELCTKSTTRREAQTQYATYTQQLLDLSDIEKESINSLCSVGFGFVASLTEFSVRSCASPLVGTASAPRRDGDPFELCIFFQRRQSCSDTFTACGPLHGVRSPFLEGLFKSRRQGLHPWEPCLRSLGSDQHPDSSRAPNTATVPSPRTVPRSLPPGRSHHLSGAGARQVLNDRERCLPHV